MAAATITLNPGTGGDKPLVDTLTTVDGAAAPAGASAQMVKVGHGAASDFKTASAANPLPVSFTTAPVTPVTDNAGSLTVDAPVGTPVFVRLSDGVAAIATLPVSLAVAPTTPVTGTFFQTTQPVSIAASVAVTGPLTDTQLRATPVPISGTISNTGFAATGNGLVSTVNSTAVALGIGGVFTGTSEDVTEYVDLRVSLFTDQPSATDGLQIQQSPNGTNWDIADTYSIAANVSRTFSVGVSSRFFRIVYTNGATASTVFRMQAKFHKTYSKGSSVRPQDARSNENDFEEMLSFSMGYNGVSWDRLRSTVANGLAVDVTRSALPTGASTETTLAALNAKVTAVNTGAVVLAAGAAVIGALTANQSINSAQVAGVATAVGSGVSGTGVQRVVLATDVVLPALSEMRSATLHVTATAAVNTAITASLPAPAAGLFHYITSVQLTKLYSVLGVAAGAGVVITSTNLPGTPAWTTEQAAGAAGTAPMVINYQPTTPLKCALAATATTFVAPAQLQTIWRWNVSYFTAA